MYIFIDSPLYLYHYFFFVAMGQVVEDSHEVTIKQFSKFYYSMI